MKVLDEFKKFAIKGNVIDLAVGVIIGASFSKIVTSLVDDLILPPIGYITGGLQFSDYKLVMKPEVLDAGGKVFTQEIALRYGTFLQVLFNFLIVAFSMFIVVKAMNKVRERAGLFSKDKDPLDDLTTIELQRRQVHLLGDIADKLGRKTDDRME